MVDETELSIIMGDYHQKEQSSFNLAIPEISSFQESDEGVFQGQNSFDLQYEEMIKN